MHGGQLFAEHTFYITSQVSDEVDVKLLKAVIKACGGTVSTSRVVRQPPGLTVHATDGQRYRDPSDTQRVRESTRHLMLSG